MNRVEWLSRRGVHLLGWQGLVGSALMIATLVCSGVVLLPLANQLKDMRSKPEARDPPASVVSADFEVRLTPQTRLEQVYAYLASGKSIEDQLAEVHVAAQASGLLLRRAEYRQTEGPTHRIRRYDVILPVTGTYAQIRHFVNVVLGANPMAALRSISFQRKRIADHQVESEIVLRFYVGIGM